MRILLIHQYFLEKEDAGGSRWNEMAKFWAGDGHEISVIAGMVHYATGKKKDVYKGKWTYCDKSFYDNVDVIRTHVSESYNKSFIGRLWAYFSFVFSGIWGGLFKAKGKFDVIVVTSPPLFVGIIAYVLSIFKRIPFVFEVRDLWPESAIDTGIITNKLIIKFAFWFEKFIYRKAKLINVLTPAFKDKIVQTKNVNAEKVIMIPNASDFTLSDKLLTNFDVSSFRKDHGLDNYFVITYVGAHGVANHLIQLIDVAKRLQNTNVLFQLIGAGMQKEMLIEETKKNNLKNVKFVDSVPKEDVFKYIMASSSISIPNTAATTSMSTSIYSNKTFDYMSCKKPILLLIDGVSRELVETANCGVYAEPENLIDIESKIRELLSLSKKDLVLLGENGYAYAKTHFDRNKLANKYLEIIKSLNK